VGSAEAVTAEGWRDELALGERSRLLGVKEWMGQRPAWFREPVVFLWRHRPAMWGRGRATARLRDSLLARIEAMERASPGDVRRTELELAKGMMIYAYERVPWYREAYRAAHVDPRDIGDLGDLSEFPTVGKGDVRDHPEAFLAEGFPKERLGVLTTSGSTGTPLALYHDAFTTDVVEEAFYERILRRASCPMGLNTRRVVLRGWRPPPERKHEFGPDSLTLSSFHLTSEHLPEFLATIRRFRPEAVFCYPSAGETLARYVLEHGEEPLPGLRVVFLASETVHEGQRELLSRAFGARAFAAYGHAERCVVAGECEYSTAYHIEPLYGLVELAPLQDGGGRNDALCEIIATGFWNRAMPLIRYRTMDLARRKADQVCRCGRPYLLLEQIEGRLQNLVVTRTGRTLAHIWAHGPAFDHVREMQFYQPRAGVLILRFVPTSSFCEDDIQRIRAHFTPMLGDDIELGFCPAEAIPRTRSGKRLWLVQEPRVREALEASGHVRAEGLGDDR